MVRSLYVYQAPTRPLTGEIEPSLSSMSSIMSTAPGAPVSAVVSPPVPPEPPAPPVPVVVEPPDPPAPPALSGLDVSEKQADTERAAHASKSAVLIADQS